MVHISGTTIQVGGYCIPASHRAGISFEVADGKREISDAIGDLTSAEWNLEHGHLDTVIFRLNDVKDFLVAEGIISHDGKSIDSKAGKIEVVLSRYESLMCQYEMNKQN